MDKEPFVYTRSLLKKSTCLKLATAASVWKDNELLGSASNLCAPEDTQHGQPVSECPRMNITTGGQYELCAPLHAEVLACLDIRPERNSAEVERFAGHLKPTKLAILAAFTAGELKLLKDATLYLVGHYWACENCLRFLGVVGITDVKFDELTAKEARNRYDRSGITK